MAINKISFVSIRRTSKRFQSSGETDDIVDLISDSSNDEVAESSKTCYKKKFVPQGHANKKFKSEKSDDFSLQDMQLFWGVSEKKRYFAFKFRPIANGRVINLEQIEDSHCPVSTIFDAQKLSLFFQLCDNKVFEEPVRMFYANLRVSKDSGEIETLVLGSRIVLSLYLFEKVFGTKFSGRVPYMNGCWPEDFEVSLDEAKVFISEPGSNLADFGPSTLCFENRILAHIIATTLFPRKGSFSSLSDRDVFVLYCLLKKIRINWAEWFLAYMVESVDDSSSAANLPYGILISRILRSLFLDLSGFPPKEISATYDSRTFTNLGYLLVDGKWSKKSVSKTKPTPTGEDKSTDVPTSSWKKEIAEIKDSLVTMSAGMQNIQESLTVLINLSKGARTSTDVSKVQLAADHLQREEVKSVNQIPRNADSATKVIDTSNMELLLLSSKNTEKSYHSISQRVINTFKYFLGGR
ncbi:hypothetical protein P3S67_021903 [Capsicum chacoense]